MTQEQLFSLVRNFHRETHFERLRHEGVRRQDIARVRRETKKIGIRV